MWRTWVLAGIASHVSWCTGKHSHLVLERFMEERIDAFDENSPFWDFNLWCVIKNNSPKSSTQIKENLEGNVNCLWHRLRLLSPKHRPLMTTVLLHQTHYLFPSEGTSVIPLGWCRLKAFALHAALMRSRDPQQCLNSSKICAENLSQQNRFLLKYTFKAKKFYGERSSNRAFEGRKQKIT